MITSQDSNTTTKMDKEILVIRSVKDSDGEYDIDRPLPISLDQWREILKDLAENDTENWNLLREFHKAKNHGAYLRDVVKNRNCGEGNLQNYIESLGQRIGERIGSFRILRPNNQNRDFWSLVLFYIKKIEEKGVTERIYRLRNDVVMVMDEMTKRKRGSSSKAKESKGGIGNPTLRFFELGMKVGDVFTFTLNPEITAKVVTDRKVFCQGKETSLSALTNELRNTTNSGIDTYWTFNGRTLRDIYRETYYPEGRDEYLRQEAERRRNAGEEAE